MFAIFHGVSVVLKYYDIFIWKIYNSSEIKMEHVYIFLLFAYALVNKSSSYKHELETDTDSFKLPCILTVGDEQLGVYLLFNLINL